MPVPPHPIESAARPNSDVIPSTSSTNVGLPPGAIIVPVLITAQAPASVPTVGPVQTKPAKPAVTDPTQIDTHRAKQIGHGGEMRELRQLTPEEKAKRRMIRNSIMLTGGILLLIGFLAILLRVKP